MSTVSHIHEDITRLDGKMKSFKDNLITFNEYVQTQVAALGSRVYITEDLFVNMMRGYRAVQDRNFLTYVELKNNTYE